MNHGIRCEFLNSIAITNVMSRLRVIETKSKLKSTSKYSDPEYISRGTSLEWQLQREMVRRLPVFFYCRWGPTDLSARVARAISLHFYPTNRYNSTIMRERNIKRDHTRRRLNSWENPDILTFPPVHLERLRVSDDSESAWLIKWFDTKTRRDRREWKGRASHVAKKLEI